MVARAAEHNVSIFRPEGLMDIDELIIAYLKYSINYDNHLPNAKYNIQNILGSRQSTEQGKLFLNCFQMKELCAIWGLESFYEERTNEVKRLTAEALQTKSTHLLENIEQRCTKRLRAENSFEPGRTSDGREVSEMTLKFIRSIFAQNGTPRELLAVYCKQGALKPIYKTTQIEKHFFSELELDGKLYRNAYLEKNKRYAEQGAALVASLKLNLITEELIKDCFITGAHHQRTLYTVRN